MDKIKKVAQSMGIITVEDMERYTALELIMMIANKMNDYGNELQDLSDKVHYLLNEGTLAEVIQIFDEWLQDGTFDTLINQSALKEVNDRIDETNAHLSHIPSFLTQDGRAYLVNKLIELNSINGTVCFVGDSITQNGWFNNINDKEYFPNISTINKGIGGDTTKDIIARLDDVKKSNANLFVLAIGVNDSRYNDERGATTKEKYINNIKTIVDDLSQAAPVVVIGIWRTYWQDQYASLGTFKNRLRVNDWNNGLESYCKTNNIPFINPNLMLDRVIDFENSKEFLKPIGSTNNPDGVHPNDDGNLIYFESVINGTYDRSRYSSLKTFSSTNFYRLDVELTNDTATGYCILKWLNPTPIATANEVYCTTSNVDYNDLTTLFSQSEPDDSFKGVANKSNEFPLTVVFGTNGKLKTLEYIAKLNSENKPRGIRSFKLYETSNPLVAINPYHKNWVLIEQKGLEFGERETIIYDASKIKYVRVNQIENTFTANSWSTLLFKAKEIEKGLDFDVNSSRFIAKTEGVYNINLMLAFLPTDLNERIALSIYKNGNLNMWLYDRDRTTNNAFIINNNVNLYLESGDYVEIRMYNSNTNQNSIDTAPDKSNLTITKY